MDGRRLRVGIVVGLAGLISWSLIGANEEGEASEAETRLAQVQAELELSRLRMEQWFDADELGAQDRRLAVAQWQENHAELIAEERRLLQQLAPPAPVPDAPAKEPVLDGLSDQEIEHAVGGYLAHECARLFGEPKTPVERKEAHRRVGEWMEGHDVAAWRTTQREARNRIRKAEMERDRAEARLYTEEELAAMPEADGIEAQIYNLGLEAVGSEPLAEGEELRDRYGRVEAELSTLREKLKVVRARQHREQRTARISELEQYLR